MELLHCYLVCSLAVGELECESLEVEQGSELVVLLFGDDMTTFFPAGLCTFVIDRSLKGYTLSADSTSLG